MPLTLQIPAESDLPDIAAQVSSWQTTPWLGQLHPGDLGWRTLIGGERTAAKLRVWSAGSGPVAIGMFDDGVLRLVVDPSVCDDSGIAVSLAADLNTQRPDLFDSGEALLEVRGADALRSALLSGGWVDDEPWTPLSLDLSAELDVSRIERAGLRIERAGLGDAAAWTAVHWSAFKGTPFDDDVRELFVARWLAMMSGPLADRAVNLIGYDADDAPVAVSTVWSAGHGRPGLIEPLGVHRDHHGHGYGVAMTLAGARALQEQGAVSANVAAEGTNPAAMATYVSSGFPAMEPVTDLRRGAAS